MTDPLVAFAPAKVNLTLSVRGRRSDGYHLLSSLVTFADIGDELGLLPGGDAVVIVNGPGASALGAGPDNLVVVAARAFAANLPDTRSGAFRLTKRLPVASGIGGGSADAAAALRLLARLNGVPIDDPRVVAAAHETGADVSVCLAGRVCLMQGIGERIGPSLAFPRLSAVLVNPGVPVETRAVFSALGLTPGAMRAEPVVDEPLAVTDLDAQAAIARLARAGNDLEPPAIRIAPVIAEALAALAAQPGCGLARMSGSGATVFGLFAQARDASAAAEVLRAARPGWWVVATSLGPAQADPPTVRNAPINAPSTASP